MGRYTRDALDALTTARRANPDISQRRLARNIFMLNDLGSAYGTATSVASTVTLFRNLGNPSEIALQHLIRRIDRDAADAARVVVGRKSSISRKPRNRSVKTVGRGTRIPV